MPVVRLAPGGGGARRRGGAGLSDPLDDLLRPLCELALEVARRDAGSQPPVPLPRGVRPLLKMTRLPPRAVATLRRALDDDDFRARIAALAPSEEAVGRAGWLFLNRPEGWEREFEALVDAEVEAAAADAAEREERTAARRLAGAEEARRRAEAARDEALRHAEAAEARAAAERRAREAAEREAAALARRLEALAAQRDEAAAGAAREEARAAAMAAELASLRARLAEAEGRLAALAAGEAAPGGEAVAGGGVVAREHGVPAGGAVAAGPQGGVDLEAVGAAVSAAAEAASRLAASLAAAAAALGVAASPGPTAEGVPGPAAEGVPGPATTARRAGGGPAAPGPGSSGRGAGRAGAGRPAIERRSAAPLPPGVREDSPEAAEHLVRLPGALLLVDGYNATLTDSALSGLEIAEQRRRLVDALCELHARCRVDVEVVFDGAEGITPVSAGPAGGRGVRVGFSPPGVDADDVILERLREVPVARPVVVASSDRRVRDGARRLGANVISARQLMALVRARGPA